MTKFIVITSGKGGAGKTTTAINLGCALSNFGMDIILVDTNLATPHLALSLGSSNLSNTLNDALKGTKHITDTAYLHPTGFKIIPSSISVKDLENRNLSQLKNCLIDLTGTADIVLLDTPAGLSDESLTVINALDELIILATPDLPSIAEAIKLINIAEKNNKNVLGAIINRSAGDKIELSQDNIKAMLSVPILGVIPEDISIKKSLTLQQPVVYTYPDSPSSIAFKKIAAQLMGQEFETNMQKTEEEKEVGFFDYITSKLQK